MSGRPNHVWGGIAFIAICVLIAALIYTASTQDRTNRQTASAEQTANQLEAQADALEEAAPATIEASTAPRIENEPEPGADIGRCHSGSCSWSKTLSSTTVRVDQGNRLIELRLLGGTSADGDGGPITWNSSSHRLWVFCSTTLPATIMRSGGGWQVDVLDFVGGVPGILHSSAAIYERTCHSSSGELTENVDRRGYRLIPSDWQELTINEPSDMFAKTAEALNDLEFIVERSN